jgi:UDP-N-acetylglucosamine 2-epimerase
MSLVYHVVGARPQFIKLASVLPESRELHSCRVIHTGQHYDKELSDDHFRGLNIPEPDWRLGVGSAPHGAQTGRMMENVERVLISKRPDAVVVYGDTNSTLAGALAAAKLDIPVVHVEAGLRSYDRSTPEEINRVLADRLSSLLLCPSQVSIRNLEREGITDGVHIAGDVMMDTLLMAAGGDIESLRRPSVEARTFGGKEPVTLARGGYYLATLHRAENVDAQERLAGFLTALGRLPLPVLFPVHPRTAKVMASLPKGALADRLLPMKPAGYAQMLGLIANSRAVFTDSGGVQKEAYYVKVPCVTLRDRTEWEETVLYGANVLSGDSEQAILEASGRTFPADAPEHIYGDGSSAAKTARIIDSFLSELGRQQ